MSKFKTALITGASKRIGKSIAIFLAKKGYNIALHFNDSVKESKQLENEICNLGVKTKCFRLNLKKIGEIDSWYKNVIKFFGEVNVLINNASTFDYDSLKTSSLTTFENHFDVNLKAPFFISKVFVESLKGKKGNIINIIDQRVLNITPYFTSYTLSKCALYTLTQSLALSLAPKIRVNAIGPGPTLKSKRQTEQEFKNQILRTPLKKQVSLFEINNSVDFLLNSESITGQLLLLDSGQNLGWAHTKSKKFIED